MVGPLKRESDQISVTLKINVENSWTLEHGCGGQVRKAAPVTLVGKTRQQGSKLQPEG